MSHDDLFPEIVGRDVRLDREELLRLARTRMPFGKHKGQLLLDLPEPYLLWLLRKGNVQGSLGRLLEQMMEIKLNGLEPLLEPLRPRE